MIHSFYFDNDISYNDGTIFADKKSIIIPKKIAFIDHYSWLDLDSRTIEKIQYQNNRFIGEEGNRCSFIYNGKLRFNQNFYQKRGIQIPVLHETLTAHSFDFELSFDRAANTIHISHCLVSGIHTFFVYNYKHDLIYQKSFSLIPGETYHITPDINNFDAQKDFTCLSIVVTKDHIVCHDEKLYLKYPID